MARAAIAIAAAVLLPVMAAANMAALHKAKKACGERVARLDGQKKGALYALAPVSALLIPLCLLRDFSASGAFAICGCGVLGFYLSVRELCFRSAAGICRNGCVLAPGYFLFDDVVEADTSSPNLLVVTTSSRAKKSFQLSADARFQVVNAIKEKNPAAAIT